jgi:hypothetical protein
MKSLNIFEIFGILVPGTIFTLGLVVLYPELLPVFNRDGFSFGDFGVIILVSYTIGNLVAGLGIILEKVYWKMFGGTPTDRVRTAKIFPETVRTSLKRRLKETGMIESSEDIGRLTLLEWKELVREIYTYVSTRKLTRRVDIFNAQYSMNRGIAAGLMALVAIQLYKSQFSNWGIDLVLFGCVALAAYRMHFYRIEYAGELFRQFNQSTAEIPEEGTAAPEEA